MQDCKFKVKQHLRLMDIESKLILRRKETYLRENLEIHSILPRLYQEGVISDDDRERIEKEDTTRDKISKFLRIIKRKLDGYSKLLEVLVVEKLNFIREELESTEIDEDTLKKEQESDEEFVKEQLSILYRESEGESISYTFLKEDIEQIKYLEGKDSRTEEEFLVRSVEQNFPTVKYEETYSSNTGMAYPFIKTCFSFDLKLYIPDTCLEIWFVDPQKLTREEQFHRKWMINNQLRLSLETTYCNFFESRELLVSFWPGFRVFCLPDSSVHLDDQGTVRFWLSSLRQRQRQVERRLDETHPESSLFWLL
ncbi:hypothetical protein KP79_PYT14188 [Mizuhopecten yessoensis]|uniref:CARD domain-containing protein n=1 Tax=Mizuhopecten yessoensis TaxID=6573 RepID=A0A210PE77_MIZYE|nr:hypothetical protein KP79_PYT14188 [Mizuhopecten yessoensis]